MASPAIIGFSNAELARFRKQMKAFDTKKTKKLQDVTIAAAYKILSAAKQNVPRYQGALFGSLRVIPSNNRLSARVWTNKEYAANVEFGTLTLKQIPSDAPEGMRPGSYTKPDFKNLLEDIKIWSKKKGMPKAAFPITLKLLKVGQRPHPFLYPALKAEIPKYIQAIKTVMQQDER